MADGDQKSKDTNPLKPWVDAFINAFSTTYDETINDISTELSKVTGIQISREDLETGELRQSSNNPKVKAIPTTYNDYKFRSRLEARWAVFFDHIGVPYEFEREGYDFGGGNLYVPDFWLPEQGCWAEIKPYTPSKLEQEKARMLSQQSGRPVYVFFGDIACPTPEPLTASGMKIGSNGNQLIGLPSYWWTECPVCGKFDLSHRGLAMNLPCGCILRESMTFCEKSGRHVDGHRCKLKRFYQSDGKTIWVGYSTRRLVVAYDAARKHQLCLTSEKRAASMLENRAASV